MYMRAGNWPPSASSEMRPDRGPADINVRNGGTPLSQLIPEWGEPRRLSVHPPLAERTARPGSIFGQALRTAAATPAQQDSALVTVVEGCMGDVAALGPDQGAEDPGGASDIDSNRPGASSRTPAAMR